MRLSALRKQKLFNSLVALSLGFNFIFSNAALALDKDRQAYGLRGMSAGERLGSSPLLDFVLQSLYRDSGISGLKKTLADLALRAPKDPVEKALKEGAGNIVIVEDKAGNLYRVSLEGNGSKTKINLAEKEESATEGFASVEAFLEFIAASNKIWASGSEYTPQQIIDAQREVKDYFQKAIRQKRIFAKEGLDIQINEYLAERISRGLPALTPDEGKKLKERLEKAFSFHNRMLKDAETKLRPIAFILDEEPSFINLDGPQSSIFRMAAAGLGRESYPFPLDLVEAYNSPAAKEEDIFPMYRALMEKYLGIDNDVFHKLRLPSLWQGAFSELKERRHSAAKKRLEEESRMTVAEVHSVNISGLVDANALDGEAKTGLIRAAAAEMEKPVRNGLFERYSLDWNGGSMLIFTLRANKPGFVNDSRVLPAIHSAALAALEEAKRRGIYKGSDLGKEFRAQVQALKIARKRSVKYSGEPQGWVKEVFGRDAAGLGSPRKTYKPAYDFASVDNVDIQGKTVLVQVDFNVPAENGHIKDIANPHPRIIEGARTIKELAEKGAKVLVMFHQGRLGEPDFMDIPFEHSRQLGQVTGRQVRAVNDLFGREAVEAIGDLKNGEILVLKPARAKDPLTGKTLEENPYFIATLFPLIDFVVNDALSVSHRASQRVTGFKGKPALGGRLLTQELQEARGLTALSHPSLFVVGGGKIPEKYKGLKFALKHFDKVIIGGRLAYLALIARQIEAANAVTLAQQKALAVKTLGKTSADDLEKEKDDITQESVFSYIPEMAALISEHRHKIAVPLDMAYLEGEKGKEARVYIELLDGRVPEGFDKQLSGIGRETARFYAEIVNRRQEPFQSAFVMGPPSDTRYSVLFDEIRAVLEPVSRIKEWYSGGGDTEDICKKLGITNAAYVFKAGGALADGLDKGFDNLPGVKFLIENNPDSLKPFVPSNREEAHIRAHSLALAPVLEAAGAEGGKLIARTIVIPRGDKVGAIGVRQNPALTLAVTNSIAKGPRQALSGFEVLEVNKQNPWLDYSISTLRSLDSRPLMIEGVRKALRENQDTVLIEIPAEKDKKGKMGKPGQVDTIKLLYRWNNMLITALREKGINQNFKVREVRPLPVFVQVLESSHTGELKLTVFVPVPNTTLWNLMQIAQADGININLKEFFEEAMPALKSKEGSGKNVFAPAPQEKAAEVVKDTPEQKPESGYPRFLEGVVLEAVTLNSASINAELQTIYYHEPETTLLARIRDSFGKNPKLIKTLETDLEKISAWLLKEFKMGRIVVPSGGGLEKFLEGKLQEESFRKNFTSQKHILGPDSKQTVFIIQPRIEYVTVGYGNEAIKVIPAFEASGFGVPNVAIFSLERRERVIHAFEMGYNVYITDRFEKDKSSKKTINLYLNYPEKLAAFEGELKGLVGEERFSRQYKGLLSKAFQEGKFNLIIDATPEGAAPENKKLLYEPALSANPDLKVIYQGGEKEGIAEMSFSAVTADYDKIYKTGSLRQVSCNTTFLSTLTFTILRWLKTDLAIDNLAFRRVVDPGDVKGAVLTSLLETSYHHGKDQDTVTPEKYIGFIKGKVNTDASQSGATTNYHIQIQYLRRADGRPLDKKEAQEVLKERSSSRIAVVDFPKGEFDSTRINEIAHNLLPQYLKNAPLGANHILIPIVTVQETDDPSELRIIAAVPQESIVAPSNVNAAHALFGLASQEASLAVVNDALGIPGIKQAVEKRLPPQVSAGQTKQVLSGVYDLLKKKNSLTVKDLKESRLGLFFEKAYAAQDILDELARTRWTVKKESETYYYHPFRIYTQVNFLTDQELTRTAGSQGGLFGHSEVREIDDDIQVKKALSEGVKKVFPDRENVFCLGEARDMRDDKLNITEEGWKHLESQLKNGLSVLSREYILSKLIIAYEPIWAISKGTLVKGVEATPEQAEQVIEKIRNQMLPKYIPGYQSGDEKKVVILYGGSSSKTNAAGLMAKTAIDGFLAGGASLKKEEAVGLIKETVAKVRQLKKEKRWSGRIPVIGFNLKAQIGGKLDLDYFKELMNIFRFIEENLRDIDFENEVRVFFAIGDTEISLFNMAAKGENPVDLVDLSKADLPGGISLAVDIQKLSSVKPGAHTSSLTAEALRLAGIKKVWNSEGVSTDDPRIKRANEAGLEVFQGANISFAATIEEIKRLLDNPSKDKIIVIPPALAREAHAYVRDREKKRQKVSSALDTAVLLAAKALEIDGGDDYFVKPTIVEEGSQINEGDSVIFLNFRSDRAEPMFRLLTADPEFQHFPLKKLNLTVAPLAVYNDQYFKKYGYKGIVKENPITETLGEVIAKAGKTQVRIGESEKFKHVTEYFDGLRQLKLEGMDTVMIPSNDIGEHWKKPEMKAKEIAEEAVKWISGEDGRTKKDFVLLNFANMDVLGHFEKFEPIVQGALVVDEALGLIRQAVRKAGGILVVEADHGSAEQKAKLDKNGMPVLDKKGQVKPHKAHSFDNKVPFIVEGAGELELKPNGSLKNTAATILELMGINKPAQMTAESLIKGYRGQPAQGPVVLVIRDGWGISKFNNPEALQYNAIYQAKLRANAKGIIFNDEDLQAKNPHTTLWAHGRYVGYPDYQMGDSEVGHFNIGSGRDTDSILYVLDDMFKKGEIAGNELIRKAIDNAKIPGRKLHLIGMLSDGGVHSHPGHLIDLLDIISKEEGINSVFLDPIFDGRDVESYEKAGWEFLEEIVHKVKKTGRLMDIFHLGTLAGRYYAMDRDGLNRDKKRMPSKELWLQRNKVWYDAIVNGNGRRLSVSSPTGQPQDTTISQEETLKARDSQLDPDVAELAKNGFGSKETQLDLSLKGIVPQVSSSIESLAQLKASLGNEKGPAGGNEDMFNSILTLQDERMDYGLSEAALSRQEEKIILIDGSVLENDYSSLLTIGRINRQFNERLGVFEEKGQAVTAANPENPYKFILIAGKSRDQKAVEGLLAVAAKRELGKSDPRDEEVRERARDYQKRFTKILTQEDMYDQLDLNNSPSIENPEYVLRQLRWTLGAGFSAAKVLAFVGPREWVEGFKKREDISSQAQGIIVGQEKDKISLAGRGLYAAVEENKDKYVMVESRDIAAGIEEEIISYRKEVDAYI